MSGCCQPEREGRPHLVIAGGGSAAFAAALKAVELNAQVTIVNQGLPIGGTCVNVGCVPSKTLLRAAEAHRRASGTAFSGIESSSRLASWEALIAQKDRLVEQLRRSKYSDLISDLPGLRLIEGRARLRSADCLEVNGERLPAKRLLIATGARPFIPEVDGLAEAGYLTNETAFQLNELPDSLLVLGGRYIALECAQMFARLGSRVTVLQRSSRILPDESPQLTEALTGYLRQEGIEIVTGASLLEARRSGGKATVWAEVKGLRRRFQASHILAATGRRPNTDGMGLEEAGVKLDRRGFPLLDETLQTSQAGIYAAGDVAGEPMFVYTAAYEGALAAENALTGGGSKRDYSVLPWVVFTDPQVAGVGLDEPQAAQMGLQAESATLPLDQLPRALAAHDTRGFIQLIRERESDALIGARILAPEGGELLMEIALAIQAGLRTEQLSQMFHPYLTLSEGVKLAALSFRKDPSKLSCCAA